MEETIFQWYPKAIRKPGGACP